MSSSVPSFLSLKASPFVVAMPTETVYGLAARIDSRQGIEAIFKIKQRPFFDPLIVHVCSLEQAKTLVQEWSQAAEILAEAFWPGPITFVLPKNSSVDPLITSGLESVGIRMPRHPLALELIMREGVPLAAPSANLFGRTSPTSAAHVASEFGNQVPIIDGGECQVGLESTVLRIFQKDGSAELAILRPGAISKSEIEAVLSAKKITFHFVDSIEKSQAPGQMKHHYMPEVPLILVKGAGLSDNDILQRAQSQMAEIPEIVEGVKIIKPNKFEKIGILKLSQDPALASRQFYSELRRSASEKPDILVFRIEKIHQGELWLPLFDRLTKAASLIV